MTFTSIRRTSVGIAVGLLLGAAALAFGQNVGNFDFFTLNGNLVTATSGSATITVPNTTQTLIGTTTLCTTGGFCKATTTLTNAQIKALAHPTPITLVAAPSAGSRIKLISASLSGNFSAGAYTNINATYAAVAIYYLGDFTQWAANGIVDDATYTAANRFSNFFGSTSPGVVDVGPYVDTPSDGNAGDLWTLPNVQLKASMNGIALAILMDNNGSSDLTGGNAANTLKVTLYYSVETL